MLFRHSSGAEFDIAELHVRVYPRYFEDCEVNGVRESEDVSTMPFMNENELAFIIDIETGIIRGWPAGITASTHYKICDEGSYALLDRAGRRVVEYDGYVPSLLSGRDNFSSDYLILAIDGTGHIGNWEPNLSTFESLPVLAGAQAAP